MHVERNARYMLEGAEALIGFLGPKGRPVELHLAETRAEKCKNCILNSPAKGWIDKVSEQVAGATRAYFRIKDDLELQVKDEDKLGICKACFCPIKLKIWMPIDYIAAHTTDEVMADFVMDCWIPNELPV